MTEKTLLRGVFSPLSCHCEERSDEAICFELFLYAIKTQAEAISSLYIIQHRNVNNDA